MNPSSIRRAAHQRTLVIVSIILVASGCKGPIEIAISGTEDMNERNAATVVVYQLSSDASFSNATVETFWRDDTAVLGSELIPGSRQRLVLYPGDSRTMEVKPSKGTRFVAFAVNLRKPDPTGWRSIHSISEVKSKTVRVSIAGNRLLTEIE